MAGIGDLFGRAGASAEQLFLWGIASAVVSALGTPYFQAVQQFSLENDPNTPLTPDQLAVMVVRHIIDTGEAAAIAKKSGIAPDQFDRLVQAVGQPPAPGVLAEAARRGIIDWDGTGPDAISFEQGLSEGDTKNKYAAMLRKLAVQQPSPADALDALLEGQVSHEQGAELFRKFGGDPDYFDLLFNTRGQAPTPTQALELLNRGIIRERGTGPASTSYEQAFLEGPWRNKWLDPFIALRSYYPPARTVTAMFHAGQLTHDQAAGYLAKQGLDQVLIEAYLAPGHTSTTSTDKHLAKTDILALYEDKLITAGEAVHALVGLNYSQHDAELIVKLTDLRVEASAVKSGTTRVKTLFLAGKLTEHQAADTLAQLGVDATIAHQTVQTWAVTATHDTRILTAAEVVAAWYYLIIDAHAAMALLQRLGYDEFDAWVMLSVRNKGPLSEVPRPSSPYPPPPPPPPLPTPGA